MCKSYSKLLGSFSKRNWFWIFNHNKLSSLVWMTRQNAGLFLSHSNLWTQHFVTFFNLKNHIKLLEMPRLRLHPVILFHQSEEKLGWLVGRTTGWHCNISYITENYQEGSESLLVQALTITVFAVSWPGRATCETTNLTSSKICRHR